MRFALLYPTRVASLTLVDTDRGFSTLSAEKRAEFVASRRDPLLAGKEPRDIADKVARSLIESHRTAGGAGAPCRQHHGAAQGLLSEISRGHGQSGSRRRSHGHHHADPFRVGAEDRLTPPHLSEAMHRDLPGSALTIIPGAGHLSNIEKPDAFNAAVLAFLLRHREGERKNL